MNPVILFRISPGDPDSEHEYNTACKYLSCVTSRMDIRPGDLVIGRYSVLPFYEEQHQDIIKAGATLINSYKEHCYVADVINWYPDLKRFTPQTWGYLQDVPIDSPGSFVLKGATNSKKFLWNTHMFAEDRNNAGRVLVELQQDSLISGQQIRVRRYVPLKTYLTAFNGLPITQEFRFFVAYGKIVGAGYYWASHYEDLRDLKIPESEFDPENVPHKWIERVIKKIGNKVNFYALDVARTIKDSWIVIELNDGQMAGLSMTDPDLFYSKLARVVNERHNNESE